MGATPEAVLISDIHFNLQTLDIASKAFAAAINKANELDVPLIVAGDLHDSKANMRGECVNRIISLYKTLTVPSYTIVGNHCRINERAPAHALHFLEPYTCLVDAPMDMPLTGAHGIPYHHDPKELQDYLATLPKGTTIIMHQGVKDADAGDYIQDKSALPKECFKDFRVISGHYHNRQDIKCGPPRKGAVGLFSYIGNPYSLSFGEANDPEKGFQILMSDGMLEFVPTNLRKHVIIDLKVGEVLNILVSDIDILWVKVRGTSEELSTLTKADIARSLSLKQNFKLDLIPTISETQLPKDESLMSNHSELFDHLIDSMSNTDSVKKERLKLMWRDLATKGEE